MAAVARRFKDPDAVVGDACVDALGTLAEYAARMRPNIHRVVLSGPDAIGPHFIRPVLEVLHETNGRAAQDVATRALARVFRRCGPGRGGPGAGPVGANWFPDGGPGRLALRLARMLDAQSFHAKAALLDAIAALFKSAAGSVGPQVPALLGVPWPADAEEGPPPEFETYGRVATSGGTHPGEAENSQQGSGGLLDALGSPDWPVRRSAAEAVAALVYALGPALDAESVTLVPGGVSGAIAASLERSGHDRVRPARDAVANALAAANALRKYEEEMRPTHDVAAWRAWVREEVGEWIASVGEERESSGSSSGSRGGGTASSPGARALAERKAPARGRTSGSKENERRALGRSRRELSEAFREANAAHGAGEDVVIKVPARPPPAMARAPNPPPPNVTGERWGAGAERDADALARANSPAASASDAEAAADDASSPVGGAEGNTYEVASSGGDERRGGREGGSSPGDEPTSDTIFDAFAARRAKSPERFGEAFAAGDPDPGAAAAEDRLEALMVNDGDAPEWMNVATEIERGGGYKPPAASSLEIATIEEEEEEEEGTEEEGEEGGEGEGTRPTTGPAPPGSSASAPRRASGRASGKTATARSRPGPGAGAWGSDESFLVVEELREQMRHLAASQAKVLESIASFVRETADAQAALTERVERMENTVGAAMSAANNVAASAAALADRDRADGLAAASRAAKLSAARATQQARLELATERAKLEAEKGQLRDAAAQLERAAAQLERVAPPIGSRWGAQGGGGSARDE